MPQMLQLEGRNPEESKDEYVKLCKLRGYFVQNVEEVNDLGETRLMAAAAEGRFVKNGCYCRDFCVQAQRFQLNKCFETLRSMFELKLLGHAGADVKRSRADGVSAIWLAAQVPRQFPCSLTFENILIS
jgi:hypothetical protein